MAFLVGYGIAGGAVVLGIYYWLYKRTQKKSSMVKPSAFVVRAPLIFGWINAVLGVVFLVYYLIAPAAFSEDTSLFSSFGLVLMTIFSSYFYFLAMPISIGSIGIAVVKKKQAVISAKRFWLLLGLNVVGTLAIAVLSYLLFA